jgi:hypothetical protein
MQFRKRGYCPFRIATSDYQAGCVLKMGGEKLCYSKDIDPLLYHNDYYSCPLFPKVKLSLETYDEIKKIVDSILLIQDKEETCLNLWPMLSGISKMKNDAATTKGREMKKISKKVKNELQDIVLNLT